VQIGGSVREKWNFKSLKLSRGALVLHFVRRISAAAVGGGPRRVSHMDAESKLDFRQCATQLVFAVLVAAAAVARLRRSQGILSAQC
jgi:hypothetical protein